MKKIYYLFRRPVIKEMALSKIGKFPSDFFYGFTLLSGFDLRVTDKLEKNKVIRYFHNIGNRFLIKIFGQSISLIPTLFQLPGLFKADIIFSTVDSYGVAVALFKKLRFIKSKIVFNTIGLCDVLIQNRNLINLYSILLSDVDMFLSGASNEECKKISSLLNIPLNKFTFIPFGIDTKYFSSKRLNEENFVLVIGADKKRDWSLYKKLFDYFKYQRFVVITHKDSFKFKVGNNVKVYFNLPIDKVREFIGKAMFLVILSKQNYHFAGQSTAFRAMSMGKSVIFTSSYGVDEYNFQNGKECYLVKPNDWSSLKKLFATLSIDKSLRSRIGKYAQKKIRSDLSIRQYSKMLSRLFNKI